MNLGTSLSFPFDISQPVRKEQTLLPLFTVFFLTAQRRTVRTLHLLLLPRFGWAPPSITHQQPGTYSVPPGKALSLYLGHEGLYSVRRNGSSKSGIFLGGTLLTCEECKQGAASRSPAETNSRSSLPAADLPAACWLTHPQPLQPLHPQPSSASPRPMATPAHTHGGAVSPQSGSTAPEPFDLLGQPCYNIPTATTLPALTRSTCKPPVDQVWPLLVIFPHSIYKTASPKGFFLLL